MGTGSTEASCSTGCSTKCTPNESLQTLAGHIIPGDMGLDLESLKTNPKMDLSSTGFFKSGKMGSILSSAGILPKNLISEGPEKHRCSLNFFVFQHSYVT
uniref:Uncharacterized protein n=1 Tax=Meleagris gallopavo TaxID=9103 RepID=A0A803YS47_MELGA